MVGVDIDHGFDTVVNQARTLLDRVDYIADDALATTVATMLMLERPLLVEGDAGVGKTELARALADMLGCELIRLQCYEGLDTAAAVYEWNYARQLLSIRNVNSDGDRGREGLVDDIYSEPFLLARPLLKAIRSPKPVVLLIDEIDRADEAFEAYLLEVLSDYQISIPEFGTVTSASTPKVVLTSNGTRELSDALRRRCLYHYLDYPAPIKELAILQRRLPGIEGALAKQIVDFVHALRHEQIRKRPGIAETLDWAAALSGFKVRSLVEEPRVVERTLACLLKTQDDQNALRQPERLDALLAAVN
jgi:MoxR-like ATPase